MAVAKRRTVRGKEVVRRFWEEVFNHANEEAVGDFLSEQFMLKDLSTGECMTRENVKEMIAGLRDHVNKPEVEVVEQMRAERDHIVSHLTLRALPANSSESSELVEINAITIDRIEDGHVVETKLMWDTLTADAYLRPKKSEYLEWRFPWW